LFGGLDVAPKQNDAAGFDLVDQRPRYFIQLGAGKTDKEKLSDLLFKW
jgi:hypothetical protein